MIFSELLINTAVLNDNQVWMAIVALNITIVGLTSLADKRSVIGIDYGKFLLNKYKFFNCVSMYTALILFAAVNIASVLVLWTYTGFVRVIFYILLILSFLFAMYYFFGFILREHPDVRQKIIKEEILGLYNNADLPANFEADKIIGMRGDRKQKKISTDVLEYFNSQNSETSSALKEVFGPDSVLYKVGGEQADYSIQYTQFYNISWEFFQMFRHVDIQDKLAIEILHLFNNKALENENEFGVQILRFNNVARMIGQVNKIGHSPGLFRYKFIEYFSRFIFEALPLREDYPDYSNCDDRKQLEEYFFNQLSIYVFRTLTDYPTETFFRSSLRVMSRLLNDSSTAGIISMQRRFDIIRDTYSDQKYGPKAFQFFLELVDNVEDKRLIIKNIVFDFGAVLVHWNQHKLFDKLFAQGEDSSSPMIIAKTNYFLNNICTPEWAARIDKGESFEYCVKELVSKYPEWRNEIEAYKERWFDMLPSEIDGMVDVVKSFKKNRFKVYGLSNWSAETFDEALRKFPILNEISDRVISGQVGMVKPDSDIFNFLFKKYDIDPHKSLFIDDNIKNVQTARQLGMFAIQFTTVEELKNNNLIQTLLGLNNNHTPAS